MLNWTNHLQFKFYFWVNTLPVLHVMMHVHITMLERWHTCNMHKRNIYLKAWISFPGSISICIVATCRLLENCIYLLEYTSKHKTLKQYIKWNSMKWFPIFVIMGKKSVILSGNIKWCKYLVIYHYSNPLVLMFFKNWTL